MIKISNADQEITLIRPGFLKVAFSEDGGGGQTSRRTNPIYCYTAIELFKVG